MYKIYLSLVLLLLVFSLPSAYAEEQDLVQTRLFKVQLFLAQGGDPEGQYYLAEMYEKGLGTPQDLNAALVWYKKSAELGNSKAVDKLAKWDKDRSEARQAKERAETGARAAEVAKAKQQADAEAAAKAKARVAAEAARAAAEAAKAAEIARAKHQADAEAAAKARADAEATRNKTRAEAAAKPEGVAKLIEAGKPAAGPVPASPPAKDKSAEGSAAAGAPTEKDKTGAEFSANPCKGPQAKFLSTCH